MAQARNSKRRETNSAQTKTKSNCSKQRFKPSNSREANNSKDYAEKGYPDQPNSNDFAWHAPANDIELLERASQIPWSFQTGERISLAKPIVGMGAGTTRKLTSSTSGTQPGVLVVREQITCGPYGQYSPTGYDAARSLPSYNAAVQVMSEMRSRARVRNTYDAPDVFMLMMAMANIYTACILGRRLAATCHSFTYQNEYMPRVLIEAQGFDAEWFLKHQFTFVTELNVIISEVNKVYVPNRMGLFKLINERYSGYFTEGSSIRDQVYMFTPAFLSMIELAPEQDYASWLRPIMVLPGEITGTDPSQWRVKYNANARYTGDQLLDVIRCMLNAVLSLQSTADITGDMSNAFGENERFVLPAINPAEIAVPVLNEEILETIHNAWVAAPVTYQFQSYDNNGGIPRPFLCLQRALDNRIGYYDLFHVFTTTWDQFLLELQGGYNLVDVHQDPDSHKTFAITRLRNPVQWITDTGNNIAAVQVMFATDLVCQIEVFTIDPATHIPYSNSLHAVTSAVTTNFKAYMDAEPFHYRPNYLISNAGFTDLYLRWVGGETDIYAEVTNKDLEVMNRISLLSLLGAYNNIK